MLNRIATVAFCSLALCGFAQENRQTIGSVSTRDALVTGGLEVQGEQAQLLNSASVTAYAHTAPLALSRGGNVLVCSTSRFHILHSGTDSSLTFALDRGAIEIHSDSQRSDVVMTPDLRMTFAGSGPLDLRIRVTASGDTCVENTGKSSPQIVISDAFSDSAYHVGPNQHVLFEHGSLREVVDQELSPCGCPAEPALPTVAGQGGVAAADVSSRNPFPAAVSQGLAPETTPVTVTKPQEAAPSEVSSTMTYNGGAGEPSIGVKRGTTAPKPSVPASTAVLAPPPSPPGAHDIVHALGRFFRRLFHAR